MPDPYTHPKTFQVVIYDDGSAAVTELERGAEGRETYAGRTFLEEPEARLVLQALRQVAACTPLERWYQLSLGEHHA